MTREPPYHVWTIDTQVFGDRREAGLLLFWQRREDGWWGYVISAQQGIGAHGDGPYVRQGFVPAAKIQPVEDVGGGT